MVSTDSASPSSMQAAGGTTTASNENTAIILFVCLMNRGFSKTRAKGVQRSGGVNTGTKRSLRRRLYAGR
jgi:hypothetical protein